MHKSLTRLKFSITSSYGKEGKDDLRGQSVFDISRARNSTNSSTFLADIFKTSEMFQKCDDLDVLFRHI